MLVPHQIMQYYVITIMYRLTIAHDDHRYQLLHLCQILCLDTLTLIL